MKRMDFIGMVLLFFLSILSTLYSESAMSRYFILELFIILILIIFSFGVAYALFLGRKKAWYSATLFFGASIINCLFIFYATREKAPFALCLLANAAGLGISIMNSSGNLFLSRIFQKRGILAQIVKNLNKNYLKEILAIFLASRAAIFFIGWLANISVKNNKIFNPLNSINQFFRWDAWHYLTIATKGYTYSGPRGTNVVFFPLYPTLVRIFSLILGNPKLVGIIISNTALIFASIYLYKLAKLDFGDSKTALKAVMYMLICPVSFFFSIFFTEGLFLFLAISSFYYARKKNWLAASILGFFLALTRTVGVLILIPILIEYLEIEIRFPKVYFRKIKKDILYLLLVPCGLFSFMVFLQMKFGDALAFSHAQAYWGRGIVFPWETFIKVYLNNIYSGFSLIMFVGFIILALILVCYLAYSKARISYIAYSLVILLVYVSTNRLDSMYRYISTIFPIYIGMAIIASRNKYIGHFLTFFSLMLLSLCTILFTTGYWFP